MTTRDKETKDRTLRSYAMATVKVIAIVVVLAVLTHLSWNLFAPELFDLPKVRMKEALGLVVFGGVLTFIFRHAITGGRGG